MAGQQTQADVNLIAAKEAAELIKRLMKATENDTAVMEAIWRKIRRAVDGDLLTTTPSTRPKTRKVIIAEPDFESVMAMIVPGETARVTELVENQEHRLELVLTEHPEPPEEEESDQLKLDQE